MDSVSIKDPSGVVMKIITSAELVRCHVMTSESTILDDTNKNTYYFILNREYLYSAGCFWGKLNYIQALKSTEMRQITLLINPIHLTPHFLSLFYGCYSKRFL